MTDALDVAVAEIDRLGLDAAVEWIGPVPVVRLLRDGAVIATGSGKRSLVGAYYEALEGFFLSRRESRPTTRLLDAAYVASQPALAADLVVRRWAHDYPTAVAACSPMRGAGTTLWYPIFLSDPAYHQAPLPGDSVAPYHSFLRYSSSIGTAAGPTVEAATRHAVCELVEHDGLSLAMLRWFVAGDPAIDLVDPASLPARIAELHAEAQAAAEARVHLVDVTTDLDVPVYVAIQDDDSRRPALFGIGAAPTGADAAERALQELVQMSVAERAPSTLDELRPWPRLLDCATLPVRRLVADADARIVPLRTDHVDVRRRLKHKDIELYAYVLTPQPYTLAVVTVVAPGLERFSLVYAGRPVVPTGRGWTLWTAATTPAS